MRLGQLDHSVLASRIGTAEWAVVEVEEPPKLESFDQRMKALVSRWGTLRLSEPVLLELPLGRSPPEGARLRLLGELRAPPGPSNGFDEAKWLRRQGIHAVLEGQSWRLVGRRGGISGVGDRVGRWLSGNTAPGLKGERHDVIEAIVLGRSSGVDQSLLGDFRATGLYHCLAVDGLKVAAVGGGAAAVVLFLGLGIYVAQFAALLTVAAYALAVGLHPSVVRAALAAGLGSLAWLAGRSRARPLAGLARRCGGAARLEPVRAVRRRVPALVRRRRVDLRRHAASRPRARGLPGVARAGAADRRVHRVWAGDRTRDVVPVPPDLARHRSRKCRGGPGRRRGAWTRAPDRGRRACGTVGRRGDGAAQRLGSLARGRMCARVRARPRRADHVPSRRRPPRPGSGRGRRLCLATWRASAS